MCGAGDAEVGIQCCLQWDVAPFREERMGRIFVRTLITSKTETFLFSRMCSVL